MLKVAAVITLVAGTAAIAQAPTERVREPPAEITNPLEVSNDPDQTLCQNEVSTGSRVAHRRVCRTRAEWAEYRAQTRQVTERVQYNKQTCEDMVACMNASRLRR